MCLLFPSLRFVALLDVTQAIVHTFWRWHIPTMLKAIYGWCLMQIPRIILFTIASRSFHRNYNMLILQVCILEYAIALSIECMGNVMCWSSPPDCRQQKNTDVNRWCVGTYIQHDSDSNAAGTGVTKGRISVTGEVFDSMWRDRIAWKEIS